MTCSFKEEDFLTIPHELRQIPHWVNWNRVDRNGSKPTKIPIDPNTGRNARTNDPSTWGGFEEALSRFSSGSVTGIGFCFTEELGIVGVDLDNCCKEPGVLTADAVKTLKQLGSYAEYSQSRMGAHALIRGKLPAGARRRGNLEIYQSGRFFVMTGWKIRFAPDVIIESQEKVERIHSTLGSQPQATPAVVDDSRYQQLLDEITFSKDASPDLNTFEDLRERSKKFHNTWERKRTDFNDETPSAYCFSLASQCLFQGWPIQEIVNLLIAWRCKWNEDLKIDRPDWYLKHTILKAEADLEIKNAASALEEESSSPEEILKNLTTTMQLDPKGYRITGFYQHGKDNARFSLAVEADETVEEIRIGSSRDLRSVENLRDLFLAHFHVIIPTTITRARWEKILTNLMRIIEVRNKGADSDHEAIFEWVERHCDWAQPHDEGAEGGWKGALPHRGPFKKDGCLYISAMRLREMLMKEGNRISQADLTQMLSLAGFKSKNMSARFEGKVVGKSYWFIGLEKFPWI